MGDNRTSTPATTPEEARWETRDRNRLLKLVERLLVERLPDECHIGVSHHAGSMYSVYRTWGTRGVHLRFEDRDGEPRAVVLTEIYNSTSGSKKITWLAGGLRAWIDALEISRDELLGALL
jgi:hypothetical protein